MNIIVTFQSQYFFAWSQKNYELPPSMINYCCHVIVVKAVT